MEKYWNAMLVRCEVCGKSFHISIRYIIRNKSKRRLCSRLCYYLSITTTTREKPGVYFHKEKGRWYVYWRENGKRIIVSRARWMWEQAYGPLPKDHVVHHKDGNKENDLLENFEAMLRDEHTAYHNFVDAVDDAVVIYRGNHECDNSGDMQEMPARILDKPGVSTVV